MRKLILIFLMFLFFASYVHAKDVTLTWNKNTEPDLAGYRLYYSNEGQNFSKEKMEELPVMETPTHLMDVADGVFWFFAVTAFDKEGLESGFSNVVFTFDGNAPKAPVGLSR